MTFILTILPHESNFFFHKLFFISCGWWKNPFESLGIYGSLEDSEEYHGALFRKYLSQKALANWLLIGEKVDQELFLIKLQKKNDDDDRMALVMCWFFCMVKKV
jgi:hypothetical protein